MHEVFIVVRFRCGLVSFKGTAPHAVDMWNHHVLIYLHTFAPVLEGGCALHRAQTNRHGRKPDI
jgi:hypothetical protein